MTFVVNIVHKQVDPPISIEMQRNFFRPNLFGPIIQNKQATVSTVLDTASSFNFVLSVHLPLTAFDYRFGILKLFI
jgi:hypothetical protein